MWSRSFSFQGPMRANLCLTNHATHLGESGLIHPRSAWNRDSPKSGQPRSNTYERPWLRSASFGYYLAFHHFLIMPIGWGLRHG